MKIQYLFGRFLDQLLIWFIRIFNPFGYQLGLAPHFFILSSGRSGSTLLRKLLMGSGNVFIPPETNSLLPRTARLFLLPPWLSWDKRVDLFIGLIRQMDINDYWQLDLGSLAHRLKKAKSSERSFRWLLNELYRAKIPHLDSVLIGEKTPYLAIQASWVRVLFPQAKIIHLVRDGRDVVMSRMESFDESLEQACNRWQWSIREIEKLAAAGTDIIEVRYEDLVVDPDRILNKLSGLLGMPNNYQQKHEIAPLGDDHLEHHANLHKPVFQSSIGRWRTGLNSSQQQEVMNLIGESLVRMGYE